MTDSTNEQPVDPQVAEKRALNKRLESIGWALFLIMMGCLWLIPDEKVPEGVWGIGVGLIMLGLNGARYLNGIRISGFTLVVGVLALGTGLGDLVGLDLPMFAILLILIGAGMLLRPLIERGRD